MRYAKLAHLLNTIWENIPMAKNSLTSSWNIARRPLPQSPYRPDAYVMLCSVLACSSGYHLARSARSTYRCSTPGPVSTWMGDCLWRRKPSQYVTNQLGQLSLSSLRGRYFEYRPGFIGRARSPVLGGRYNTV